MKGFYDEFNNELKKFLWERNIMNKYGLLRFSAKRGLKGDFTMVSNLIFDCILQSKEITATEKAIALYIYRRTIGCSNRTYIMNKCKISKGCGVSWKTVSRAINRLQKVKILLRDDDNDEQYLLNPFPDTWYDSDAHASVTDWIVRKKKSEKKYKRPGRDRSIGPKLLNELDAL